MSEDLRTVSLARGSIVTFGGAVANSALAFVMTGIVGNRLGTASTGLFFQATAVFAIVASLLPLGADTALVRGLSREQALGRAHALVPTTVAALLPVMALSLVAALAMRATAPQLAAVLNPDSAEATQEVIATLALFLPAAPLLGVALGGSRGLGSVYPYTALQNIAVPAGRVLAIALATAWTLGLHDVVVGWAVPLALAAAVAIPVFLVLLRRASASGPPSGVPFWQQTRAVAGPFWAFALPRGGTTLIERVYEWTDVLLVIALAGPEAGGVYGVVTRCATAGVVIENAARIVTGPRISSALAKGDLVEARSLFADVTRVLVLSSWPLFWVLIVFGAAVLGLFGEGFEEGAPALAAVSVAMMGVAASGMLQSFLLMGGRSHWQLVNRLVKLSTLVLGCLVLVPRIGILGAALSWVAALCVDTALAGNQVFRRMGISSSPRLVALPVAVASVVWGLGALAVRAAMGPTLAAVGAALVLCGAVYVAICFRWRARLGIAAFLEHR